MRQPLGGALGQQGGGTRAAGQALEPTGGGAGFLELRAAQLFADFVAARFQGQHLREELDRVIHVLALQSILSPRAKRPEVP